MTSSSNCGRGAHRRQCASRPKRWCRPVSPAGSRSACGGVALEHAGREVGKVALLRAVRGRHDQQPSAGRRGPYLWCVRCRARTAAASTSSVSRLIFVRRILVSLTLSPAYTSTGIGDTHDVVVARGGDRPSVWPAGVVRRAVDPLSAGFSRATRRGELTIRSGRAAHETTLASFEGRPVARHLYGEVICEVIETLQRSALDAPRPPRGLLREARRRIRPVQNARGRGGRQRHLCLGRRADPRSPTPRGTPQRSHRLRRRGPPRDPSAPPPHAPQAHASLPWSRVRGAAGEPSDPVAASSSIRDVSSRAFSWPG